MLTTATPDPVAEAFSGMTDYLIVLLIPALVGLVALGLIVGLGVGWLWRIVRWDGSTGPRRDGWGTWR